MVQKLNSKNTNGSIIIASNIYEYDIRKANISILYQLGLITREKYLELYDAPRMKRQYEIGCMQRDNKDLTTQLRKGILTAVNIFIKKNNILPENIIRHSNDAIYTHGVEAMYTNITENIVFVKKAAFTSYMKSGKYEFFYRYDQIHGEEFLKVLGINNYEIHTNSFLLLISTIFNTLETFGVEEGYKAVCDIISVYKDREYPIEFYREFNSHHSFRFMSYIVNTLSEEDKDVINIDYNLSILVDIKQNILKLLIP